MLAYVLKGSIFMQHLSESTGSIDVASSRYSDQEYEADDYCCLTQQDANMCGE